jgi:hypothetical protein
MRGTWSTDSSGGGSLLLPVLALIGIALAAGPAAAAVAELVHALIILVIAFLGLAAGGAVAIIAWRVHRSRAAEPVRVIRPGPPPWRPVQRVPEARPLPQAPPRAIRRPGEIHIHLHSVSPEDVAEIIARRNE